LAAFILFGSQFKGVVVGASPSLIEDCCDSTALKIVVDSSDIMGSGNGGTRKCYEKNKKIGGGVHKEKSRGGAIHDVSNNSHLM